MFRTFHARTIATLLISFLAMGFGVAVMIVTDQYLPEDTLGGLTVIAGFTLFVVGMFWSACAD